MARDIFIKLDRCQYCNRPGFVVWDADLFTCGHEVCRSLAFAEVRRRHRNGRREVPEKRLARALLSAFDHLDDALRLDERAEVLSAEEAERLRGRERQETARVLSELRELERRYPVRPSARAPAPADPRHRRFVRRGHTVPLGMRTRPQRSSARPRMPAQAQPTTIVP
jgi:hypothetical protein